MIVIKGFEMPSSCYDCPFAKNKKTNDYGSSCECGVLEDYEIINLLKRSKSPNCPLVEQEPILDKIKSKIRKKMRFNSFNEGIVSFDDISKILDKYKSESEDEE